jgi:hypothetical protein
MSRPSLRVAIDAMCKSCIYDPGSGDGGWREQVAGCSSSNCPLHSVRPLPVKTTKPVLERRNAAALVTGPGERFDSFPSSRIGLNDLTTDERRAA